MDSTVLLIFAVVYLGMLLGEIPGLALDRSGVALLGAIALVATQKVTVGQAWNAVDVPTIALLLGLMVVSAQFRLGGFYARVSRWLAEHEGSPELLLALLVSVARRTCSSGRRCTCRSPATCSTRSCLPWSASGWYGRSSRGPSAGAGSGK